MHKYANSEKIAKMSDKQIFAFYTRLLAKKEI